MERGARTVLGPEKRFSACVRSVGAFYDLTVFSVELPFRTDRVIGVEMSRCQKFVITALIVQGCDGLLFVRDQVPTALGFK